MRAALLLALLLGCGGCERPTGADGGAGLLSVAWTGKETGRFRGTAGAQWCARDSMLEVFATRGDTGLGFVLVAPDTVRAVQYPVIPPEANVDWRPLGAVALRWFGPTEVLGYQATGGVISVTSVDSGPSGTIDVRLQRPGGTDTLHLTGTFTALRVTAAPAECGRVARAQ